MSRVKAVQTASDLIARQGVIEHKEALIPDKIRAGILGLKEGLERLEHEINEIQRNIIFLSNNEQYSFEDSFVAVMSNDIHSRIQVSLDQMEVEFDSLDESMKKSIYEYFRHRMAELLYQSPFSKRSVEKPLGYAGDFEMMNILYREENLGDSLFAKCLHRCYLNFKNAQAVRNRVDYFHKAILSTIEKSPSDRPVRILSVACGPAEEIQRLLLDRAIPWERVEIHLLDQDLGALRNAQAGIRLSTHGLDRTPSVKYLHMAIKNVIVDGIDGKYDLIYSAGLFDYLSDPVAKMAAQTLTENLTTGGKLVIGNFTAVSGMRLGMDLILDWKLIYRSEVELRRLYSVENRAVTVESEPERVNLFVVIQ
jgi:chemotaxis methyl-accepting protein methylase